MKWIVAAALIVAAGMAVFELVMHPTAGERVETLLLFLTMAAISLAATRLVPAAARHAPSLGHTVAAVAIIAALLIAVAGAAGAWRMFLSVHDLHLLSIVLGVAAGLSIVFALGVTRSMRSDLAAVRRTTDQVAAGDLTARTGVDRADELGATAAALDAMIGRLAEAEAQRRSDDDARRALLAAIGHDLRTPLAALQAAVEALEDGLAPDPDRYLQAMSHDVAHLRGLVDDFFVLARIESGDLVLERQPVDLTELADETIETMEPVARRVHVELHLDTVGSVPVVGGPEALARVMRNLVDNAIRHAPAESRVTVRVLNGDGATVEIIDDGPGFDADLLPSIFDPSSRADPSRRRDTGGAGLGLAIAKGVVEAHGGRIWALPGPGGRVGFQLPAASPR